MLATARTVPQTRLLLKFLSDRSVVLTDTPDLRFIARIDDAPPNAVRGVVAYNGFNGRTCAIHVAGDGRWMNRDFLIDAFHYPFVLCDIVQLFGMVSGKNDRALALNEHLGFTVMHRITNGWDHNTDLVVMGMHKAECRWLKMTRGKNGHAQREAETV